MVSRIQVSEVGEEDLLVWPLTSDGNYSVKSTYCLLDSEEGKANPSSSTITEQKCLWKKLWKIRSPTKIRHFMWRAAKDSLPTKQNLQARHVPVEETCELCGEQKETLLHSLWWCDQAQYVWKSDPSFVSLYQRQYRSFLDLISKVLDSFSTYRIALFSTIAWALWQRRNRIHEHQHSWNLSELGSRAKELIGEYFNANS